MKKCCNFLIFSEKIFVKKGQKSGFLLHIYVHINKKRLLSLLLYLSAQNEKILDFLHFIMQKCTL